MRGAKAEHASCGCLFRYLLVFYKTPFHTLLLILISMRALWHVHRVKQSEERY